MAVSHTFDDSDLWLYIGNDDCARIFFIDTASATPLLSVTYLLITYPDTLPDLIAYHSSLCLSTSHTPLLGINPTTIPVETGSCRMLRYFGHCTVPTFLYWSVIFVYSAANARVHNNIVQLAASTNNFVIRVGTRFLV